MRSIEFAYMFGRYVETTRSEVESMLRENVKELKEIMKEFHNFFTKLAREKGEIEGERISHRFATLLYSAVKLYFFTNWRLANVGWEDILALEVALTEMAIEVADGIKEDTEKEKENNINIR